MLCMSWILLPQINNSESFSSVDALIPVHIVSSPRKGKALLPFSLSLDLNQESCCHHLLYSLFLLLIEVKLVNFVSCVLYRL